MESSMLDGGNTKEACPTEVRLERSPPSKLRGLITHVYRT